MIAARFALALPLLAVSACAPSRAVPRAPRAEATSRTRADRAAAPEAQGAELTAESPPAHARTASECVELSEDALSAARPMHLRAPSTDSRHYEILASLGFMRSGGVWTMVETTFYAKPVDVAAPGALATVLAEIEKQNGLGGSRSSVRIDVIDRRGERVRFETAWAPRGPGDWALPQRSGGVPLGTSRIFTTPSYFVRPDTVAAEAVIEGSVVARFERSPPGTHVDARLLSSSSARIAIRVEPPPVRALNARLRARFEDREVGELDREVPMPRQHDRCWSVLDLALAVAGPSIRYRLELTDAFSVWDFEL